MFSLRLHSTAWFYLSTGDGIDHRSARNILNVNETVVKTDCQGLTMKEVTASYSDVFKGLGCMETALHLEVDTTVAPAITPPRRVPLTLKDRLQDIDSPGESKCYNQGRRTNRLGV